MALGSSRGVNSGSRRYHNFNLYCAGFGPFLAADVAQAAGAAAGKWARYSRRSKPALTALVRPLTLTLSFKCCRRRRRCVCVCECVQETSKSERKEGEPDGYELRGRLGGRHGSSGEPSGASNIILLREIGTHLVRW